MRRPMTPWCLSRRELLKTFLLCSSLVHVPLTAVCEARPARFRIAVFTPTTSANTYWPAVHATMRLAAADLGIDVEIHEFDVSDRFAAVSTATRRLAAEPVPDAAVLSMELRQALPVADMAETAKIPFSLHGPFSPRELEQLGGKPGSQYQSWVGYFHEDEQLKGYLLAHELIAAARERNRKAEQRKIHVAGINGARSWAGSSFREAGLRQALEESADAHLLQMVYSHWTVEEGERMAEHLLRRYPDVSVLWAASDQLAIGAAKAVSARRGQDGTRVITGGLDLSRAGLRAVARGTLVATVASTTLLWAQVIIDLHDYLHGTAPPGRSHVVFPPLVATQSTVQDILHRIQRHNEINFRDFSRVHHGSDAPRLDNGLERS